MKKRNLLLALCILFVASSCSLLIPEEKFAPPAWILGTWADAFNINVYSFTDDNVVFTTTSGGVDFAEAFKSASVEETTSTTLYEIQITASGALSKYKFSKLTSTTLNYTITTSGISVGPLVLTKR